MARAFFVFLACVVLTPVLLSSTEADSNKHAGLVSRILLESFRDDEFYSILAYACLNLIGDICDD